MPKKEDWVSSSDIFAKYALGWQDPQIAEFFGISKQAVHKHRQKMGLPKNKPVRKVYQCACCEVEIASWRTLCHDCAAKKRKRTPQAHWRLSDRDVVRIFKMRADGVLVEKIAEKYRTKLATIYHVLRRLTWRHVPIDPQILEAVRGMRRASPARKRRKRKVT